MNTFNLTLDLAKAKQRQQQTIFVRQGDQNGTTIVATITDHGVAASTSGLTARFQMKLPDGTHYYRKAASLSGNVATVALDETQAASIAGRTDVAYFQLLQGSTVVASTESFTVIVLPDALADATGPESYDSAIQEAIDNANEAAEAAREAAQQTIPDGSVTADKIADAVRKGYVRSFETVADMQAATDIKAGMTCHTNGFHASGDGGAAYYTVSTSGNIALQGGLYASEVNVSLSNAAIDEITDGETLTSSGLLDETSLTHFWGNVKKYVDDSVAEVEIKNLFVIFGDSWSDFDAGFENWVEYANVANTLDVDIRNFANGGAGFLVTGNLVSSQITEASSTLTAEEKVRTKYVILEGGVNDTGVSGLTYTNFRNAVRAAITSCVNMFPNAQIIYAPNMCSYAYDATRAGLCMSYFYKMKDDIKWTPGNVKSAPILPYFWLGFKYSEVFRTDNLHLNRYGAINFGKCILDACLGMSQDSLKHYYKLGNLIFAYDDTGNIDVSGTYDFNGNTVQLLISTANEFTEYLYMWTNVSPLLNGAKRNPFWTGMTADCANHGWIRYDGNFTIKANSDYSGSGNARVFF